MSQSVLFSHRGSHEVRRTFDFTPGLKPVLKLLAWEAATLYIDFVSATPDLVVNAIERLRRCGRGRILTGHGGPQDAVALDYALAYVKELSEYAGRCFANNTQSRLSEAKVEDFLPRQVVATDLDRRYHRRNLDYLMQNGQFLFA